jgi:hypothetical protein
VRRISRSLGDPQGERLETAGIKPSNGFWNREKFERYCVRQLVADYPVTGHKALL